MQTTDQLLSVIFQELSLGFFFWFCFSETDLSQRTAPALQAFSRLRIPRTEVSYEHTIWLSQVVAGDNTQVLMFA